MLVLLIKGESALVTLARAEAGLPPAADTQAVAAPRPSGLRRLRRRAGALPFYRAFVAMEATMLALAAAIVDAVAGDLIGSRVLVIALVAMTAITAARAPARDPHVGPAAMIGCIVLTQGRRPAELAAALDSLAAQRGVELDVVVVGNGWEPVGLPDGVRARRARRGPRDRRPGATPASARSAGELLFFLDDDARLAAPDALARVAARFAAIRGLGLLQLRVRSSDGGAAAARLGAAPARRRPGPLERRDRRLGGRGGDPPHGVRAGRRLAGGVPLRGHEGVDLAWRVMDAGHRVLYAGDIEVLHPSYRTAPHDVLAYYGARNRVCLARRHLPLPLGVLYVAAFVAAHAAGPAHARPRPRRAARLPRRPARAVRPAPPPAC